MLDYSGWLFVSPNFQLLVRVSHRFIAVCIHFFNHTFKEYLSIFVSFLSYHSFLFPNFTFYTSSLTIVAFFFFDSSYLPSCHLLSSFLFSFPKAMTVFFNIFFVILSLPLQAVINLFGRDVSVRKHQLILEVDHLNFKLGNFSFFLFLFSILFLSYRLLLFWPSERRPLIYLFVFTFP